MNNENMDRLFREVADQYEIKPSATAWEAIQGQVESKATSWAMAWKVAAALVVTLSSVLVILNWEDKQAETLAGTADHPQLVGESFAWDLSEVTAPFEDTHQQVAAQTEEEPVMAPIQAVQSIVSEKYIRPFLELNSLKVAVEIQMPEKPALFMERETKTSVTIRYFASASEAAGEEKKKSIGQFIARAQAKLSPDELLADIRTAKDDLFKSNRGD